MIGLLFNYTAEFHVIMEIFLRVFELKNWNYLTGLFFFNNTICLEKILYSINVP